MARFSGRQAKGAMRLYRTTKRQEAETRQARVQPSRTKRYRSMARVLDQGAQAA